MILARRKHAAVFLITTAGIVALASRKQKPGMLLNIPQGTGQHLLPSARCSTPLPTAKACQVQKASGAKVEDSVAFLQDSKHSFIDRCLQCMKHWVFQENKAALKAHHLVRKADRPVCDHKTIVNGFSYSFARPIDCLREGGPVSYKQASFGLQLPG